MPRVKLNDMAVECKETVKGETDLPVVGLEHLIPSEVCLRQWSDDTYLRMNNITYGGELDLSDTKRISVPEKELSGCMVKKGDVLFNRTNSRDLVGKTCTFDFAEPMIIAGYIIRLRMNGRVLPTYLSAFLNLESSKKMLFDMAKGAVGQANINAQEVQDIKLIIPPIDVQKPFQALVQQLDKSKHSAQKALENLQVSIPHLIEHRNRAN